MQYFSSGSNVVVCSVLVTTTQRMTVLGQFIVHVYDINKRSARFSSPEESVSQTHYVRKKLSFSVSTFLISIRSGYLGLVHREWLGRLSGQNPGQFW
jgi:hypothetical protein